MHERIIVGPFVGFSQGIVSLTRNKFLTKKFLYQYLFLMVRTIILKKIKIQFFSGNPLQP